MSNRNLIIILFLFVSMYALPSCTQNKYSVVRLSANYDLQKPLVLLLNDALLEISGIYFYAKDSSVFAISDEEGYLFKIHLNNNVTQKWKFSKPLDFEDLFLHDSTFYVLESNGNIHALHFSPGGDTIYSKKSDLSHHKGLEFESLYYDEQFKKLVMICKNCEADKKSATTAWAYDPATKEYTPSLFTIDVDTIAKITGEKKLKFKPSAATINPITHDVWILSAINQLIVVTDRNGNFKEVFTLAPKIFTQPEGITFTPWGDLIISDEAGDKYGKGNLLIFKPKKNN